MVPSARSRSRISATCSPRSGRGPRFQPRPTCRITRRELCRGSQTSGFVPTTVVAPTGFEPVFQGRLDGSPTGRGPLPSHAVQAVRPMTSQSPQKGPASNSMSVCLSSSSARARHCGRSRDAFPAAHLPSAPCHPWAHPSCRPAARLHRGAPAPPSHQQILTYASDVLARPQS